MPLRPSVLGRCPGPGQTPATNSHCCPHALLSPPSPVFPAPPLALRVSLTQGQGKGEQHPGGCRVASLSSGVAAPPRPTQANRRTTLDPGRLSQIQLIIGRDGTGRRSLFFNEV